MINVQISDNQRLAYVLNAIEARNRARQALKCVSVTVINGYYSRANDQKKGGVK